MFQYIRTKPNSSRTSEGIHANSVGASGTGDLVIADLARWKDWNIQDQLLEMYDKEDFNIPSIKRAIVRYFFYCSTDIEEGTPEAEHPAYAISAKEHLQKLEEKDPKTVRDARRFLIR